MFLIAIHFRCGNVQQDDCPAIGTLIIPSVVPINFCAISIALANRDKNSSKSIMKTIFHVNVQNCNLVLHSRCPVSRKSE